MKLFPHNIIDSILPGLRFSIILGPVSCAAPRYDWNIISCVGGSSATAEEASEMNAKIDETIANPNPDNMIWQGPSEDTAGRERAFAKWIAENQLAKTEH